MNISISSITIPVRQRKGINQANVDSLAASIASLGLFTPVLVSRDNELIAGHHRLQAISSLHAQGLEVRYGNERVPAGMVPFILFSDTSLTSRKEAELHENTKRVQLTWQEEAAAIAELHALRGEQAQQAGKKQTFEMTSSEIMNGFNTLADNTRVSQSVVLAKHLDDPEVRGAENPTQALRIVEKKERQALRERQQALLGPMTLAGIDLIEANVFEWVADSPSLSYEILVSDPPYGVNADTFGSQFAADHQYSDTPAYGAACIRAIASALNKCTSTRAAAFIFCDVDFWADHSRSFAEICPEWKVWGTPLIWNKYPQGALPIPDRGPRAGFETIIYLYKGPVRWIKTGCSDIIQIPGVTRPEFGAQKPPELFTWLLEAVGAPGDRVLDLFAGTCPSAIAATALHHPITCVEMNASKLAYAREKLS